MEGNDRLRLERTLHMKKEERRIIIKCFRIVCFVNVNQKRKSGARKVNIYASHGKIQRCSLNKTAANQRGQTFGRHQLFHSDLHTNMKIRAGDIFSITILEIGKY